MMWKGFYVIINLKNNKMADKEKTNLVNGQDIFIFGKFDDSMVENIIQYLPTAIKTESQKKKGEINIYINSHGGYAKYVWTLISLLEMAKNKGIEVNTYVTGVAYSCASMLAIVGTNRYIGINSEHLVHLGTAYFQAVSTKLQLKRETEATQKHFERLIAHYEKYTKIKDLEEKLRDDSYFIFDKDIIKQGLADKFIEDIK